jgi:cellulose synthase/poly-beta-1,6-N-acetylglucosamine synthase-like glycosyltransferase
MMRHRIFAFSLIPLILGATYLTTLFTTNYILLTHPLVGDPQIITTANPFTIEIVKAYKKDLK